MIDAAYEPTFFRLAADVKEALRVQARVARAADPDAVAKMIAAASE